MDVIKAKDIDSKEFKKHILSFYTNHESGYNVVHSITDVKVFDEPHRYMAWH